MTAIYQTSKKLCPIPGQLWRKVLLFRPFSMPLKKLIDMKRDKTFEKIMQSLIGKKVIKIIPESSDRDDFSIVFDDNSELYVDILQGKVNNPPKRDKG